MPRNQNVASSQLPTKSARRRARKKALERKFTIEAGKLDINTPIGPQKIGSFKISSRSRRGPGGQTVGLAPHSMQVQTVMPRIKTKLGGKYGATDILCGTEYLQSVNSADGGNFVGDILSTILINPRSFVDTRLFQFAALYQRYRFKRLEFIYEPIANATVSGQLIGFGDYDPDNIIVNDDPLNVSTAAAHMGMKNTQVWEPSVFPFGIVDDFTTLYTSLSNANEPRLVYQGVYYLISASELPASTALGNIYVDYEVELNVPILQDTALIPKYYSAGLIGTATSHDPNLRLMGTSGDLEGYELPDGWDLPGTHLSMTYTGSDGGFRFNPPNGSYLIMQTWSFAAPSSAPGYHAQIETVITGQQSQNMNVYPAPPNLNTWIPSQVGDITCGTATSGQPAGGTQMSAVGFFTVDNEENFQQVFILPSITITSSGSGYFTTAGSLFVISVGAIIPEQRQQKVTLDAFLKLHEKKLEADKVREIKRKDRRLHPECPVLPPQVKALPDDGGRFTAPKEIIDKGKGFGEPLSDTRMRIREVYYGKS